MRTLATTVFLLCAASSVNGQTDPFGPGQGDRCASRGPSRTDSARVASIICEQAIIRVQLNGLRASLIRPHIAIGGAIAYDSAKIDAGDRLSNPLQLSQLSAIQVRSHKPFWGWIIGGTLGLGLGVGIGAFAETFCIFDCATAEYSVGEGVVYGVVGAAFGALLGAGIDSLIPKWRTVFEPDRS